MTWRDRLRPAGFRGIQFFVDGHNLDTGRRAAKHEYPQKNDAYIEDMGRKCREFSFEAYVLGPDYDRARDSLLDACETAGPGELQHPVFGRKSVVCISCRVSESRQDGGIAKFSLTFAETIEPSYPSPVIDSKNRAKQSAEKTISEATGFFAKVFSVVGMASSAIKSATDFVQDVSDTMNAVLAPIRATQQAIADVKHQIDNLALNVDSLVRAPFDLAGDMSTMLRSFAELPATPSLKIGALLDAYGLDDGPTIPETTPQRQQEKLNRDSLAGLFRQVIVSETVRMATDAEFESYDAALSARERLADLIDEQAEAVTDDDLFKALMTMRSDLTRAVPGDGNSRARVITYTPNITLPALVIAQELYGDASRADDIASRNHLRHPGFVLGGRGIEVLSE